MSSEGRGGFLISRFRISQPRVYMRGSAAATPHNANACHPRNLACLRPIAPPHTLSVSTAFGWKRALAMRKLLLTVLLLSLIPVVAGCTSQDVPRAAFSDDGDYLPRQRGPGLVPRDRSPIPDVPMLVGFVAVPSRSDSYVDGASIRHVRHVYQGRSNVAEVVNFYRQQLPRHGWASRGRSTADDGSVTMRFTKGAESLRLHVAERNSVITKTVTIGPREQ